MVRKYYITHLKKMQEKVFLIPKGRKILAISEYFAYHK